VFKQFFLLILVIFTFSGCFSLSSDCSGTTCDCSGTTSNGCVTGIAATGAAAANQTVYLQDADGTIVEATTSAEGSFSINLDNLTAPYLLWFVSNNEKIYSASFEGGVANINPLTNAVVRLAYYDVSGIDDPETVAFNNDIRELIEQGIRDIVSPILDLYGATVGDSGFVAMEDFEANGLALDGIFDDYIIDVVEGELILTLRDETTPVLEVTSDDIMLGSDSVLVTTHMTDNMLNGLLNRVSFNTIKGDNTSESSITSDLALIDEVGNGTTVSWASSNESVISNTGVVTSPFVDELVELVLTISKNDISVSKTFSLTVVGDVTPEELQAVEADKAELTFDVIKDNNHSADRIYFSLALPTTGASGTDISWSTSSSYISSDGLVTRPNYPFADEHTTLTATISYGNASDTKTFDLTVKSSDSHVVFANVNYLSMLKSDGTYWSWGDNQEGQLGNGTDDESHVPVQGSTEITDLVQLKVRYRFVSALKSDGTIWSWGLNDNGQLGDGTIANSYVPVQESTGATDWVEVAAGRFHTVAIKSDGTLWGWGLNSLGQLGNGSTNSSVIPVQESTGATDWVKVAADEFHTVALKSDGTIWSWGGNADGQLGNERAC